MAMSTWKTTSNLTNFAKPKQFVNKQNITPNPDPLILPFGMLFNIGIFETLLHTYIVKSFKTT